MIDLQRLLLAARKQTIALSAVKVALVVGTVLNVINQGGRILDGLPLSGLQMILNYLVPYCVSSYSAACNELSRTEVRR